ncbi:CBO0543 family protein [Bacillus sp. CGMCC 1.16607]|uniref:CBO0543 family protein n=1 Tax=Bacillus sp. CGMCC 1.16607 TaxID=3351842 RepID=UPI003643AB64
MNIVKPLKDLNWQLSPKKLFFCKKDISILLLASLIGTYLDLYFVGKGYYSFPYRLFPTIFSINIAFTLVILPIFTYLLILFVKKMDGLKGLGVLILVSLIIACMEKFSEEVGFFIHHEQWKHLYSFFGYFLYLVVMWGFYRWVNK